MRFYKTLLSEFRMRKKTFTLVIAGCIIDIPEHNKLIFDLSLVLIRKKNAHKFTT